MLSYGIYSSFVISGVQTLGVYLLLLGPHVGKNKGRINWNKTIYSVLSIIFVSFTIRFIFGRSATDLQYTMDPHACMY